MSNEVFVIRMRQIARLSGCEVHFSMGNGRRIAHFSDGAVIVI